MTVRDDWFESDDAAFEQAFVDVGNELEFRR